MLTGTLFEIEKSVLASVGVNDGVDVGTWGILRRAGITSSSFRSAVTILPGPGLRLVTPPKSLKVKHGLYVAKV